MITDNVSYYLQLKKIMELETIIGLEIHVQMNTRSKMFCSCDNDSFQKEPNTNICPVCTGFPGQLPVLNGEALKKGLLSALALNLEINEIFKFDRKHYFYPDNPKGYQISQYDEPMSKNGYLDILDEDLNLKRIRIERVHLEDDAGKLTHAHNGSLCDFNRAGTPLMEIVTCPDMRSSTEAKNFAEKIQTIMRCVGSSDCDMEKGMMRFDASISLRPKGEDKLYPRVEIKNLNSFRFLKEALDFEIEKQRKLWENGTPITRPETAGWIANLGRTETLREKEEAADYRYFPEPDIPPFKMDKNYIEELRKSLPKLPEQKKEEYMDVYGIKEIDAQSISNSSELSLLFDEAVRKSNDAKSVSNWLITVLLGLLNQDKQEIKDLKFKGEDLGEMIIMINEGKISGKIAKDVFEEMYKVGAKPREIVEKKGLTQISDVGEIEKACEEVLNANPESVLDFKNGKDRALGRLVGEVMKKTSGKANPKMVNEILIGKIR